ncbi:MAG: glycerate kinase [Dehalococcoidales bacterium]|nr:glycerate kinase [Dehalococcoidales bacterium]
MKIVVAPQSFKGSLPAREVADAIVRGIRRVLADAEVVVLPMADGGEGTVDALVYATGGRTMQAEVTGPLGDRVLAIWGILGDGVTAVVEMAAASGLKLVPQDRLDPLAATTYGTGELVRAVLDSDCHRLIIGIGGSATNDGGAGMAQALGAKLTNREGRELPPGGAALASLRQIDVSGLDSRLTECQVTVACDVTNPLCGKEGASWVYGPQKGATEEMCRQLDDALASYASVIKKDLGIGIKDMPGAGAAGGLGAGLVAFLGARLVPGIEIVSDAVGLVEHLKGASLVLTGEGRLDTQTTFGKTVSGVAKQAKVLGIPVVVIAGELHGDLKELYQHGINAALSIAPGPITREESEADAARLISDAAERALRLVLINPS